MSIHGLRSWIMTPVKSMISIVQNIPHMYADQKMEIIRYITTLRYKLRHLRETNINLGIYHITLGNFDDAILRFKLINKFISPGDTKVYYMLGWCYFFKKNYSEALNYLAKSGEVDNQDLEFLIRNRDNIDTIPATVWQKYRTLNVVQISSQLQSRTVNLPHLFVKELCDILEDMQNNCQILDIETGLGLIGTEFNKTLRNNYHLTGVEDIEWMVDIATNLRDERYAYDTIQRYTLSEFLSTNNMQYDIITSLYGLRFSKNLSECFVEICRRLKPSGYFAILFPATTNKTTLRLDRCGFEYNRSDIEKQLRLAELEIISIKEWSLNKLDTYTMVISTKIR